MANKTVDQLSTLSGININDYFVVYDASETGPEKLKKYSADDFSNLIDGGDTNLHQHDTLENSGTTKVSTQTDGARIFSSNAILDLDGTGTAQYNGGHLKLFTSSAGHTINNTRVSHFIEDGGNTNTVFQLSAYTDDAFQWRLANYQFSDDTWYIRCADEIAIKAAKDGSVDLYYDNAKKFGTTANGAEISNSSAAAELIVSSDTTGDAGTFSLKDSGSGNLWQWVMRGTDNPTEPDDLHLSYWNGGWTGWISFDQSASNITLRQYLQFTAGTRINEFSTDGTLAGNSDDAVPTEKAVKTYVDANVGGSLDITTTASGFTISDSNDIIEITGSGETVVLHAASTAATKRYDIKNTSSGAITVSGTDMIDDGYSISIPSYESRTVVPTGSKWIII
jgi:hypothetical protein